MMRSLAMSLRNLLGSGTSRSRRALIVGSGSAAEIDRARAWLGERHPGTPIDLLADPWIERPEVAPFELPGVDGGSHRLWRRLRQRPYDVVVVLWTGRPTASRRWKMLGAFSLLATQVWIVTEYGPPFALARSELRTLARHTARRWRHSESSRPRLGDLLALAVTAPLLLTWLLFLRLGRIASKSSPK